MGQTDLTPDDKPELSPELLKEWQGFLTEMLAIGTQKQDVPSDFSVRFRQFYEKLLAHWSLYAKPVICPTCQRDLNPSRQLHSLQPSDTHIPCQFAYNAKNHQPTFQYWCTHCQTWTTEEYGVVH